MNSNLLFNIYVSVHESAHSTNLLSSLFKKKSISPSLPPAAAVCLYFTSGSILLFIWHFCVLTELSRGACSWLMGWQSNSCYSVISGQKSHKTLTLPISNFLSTVDKPQPVIMSVMTLWRQPNHPTLDCFELINAFRRLLAMANLCLYALINRTTTQLIYSSYTTTYSSTHSLTSCLLNATPWLITTVFPSSFGHQNRMLQ